MNISTRKGKYALASALCGALLYVKGRSIPALVGQLTAQIRLPEGIRHVWIVDRGIISRPLLRALQALSQFALGRVRSNQVVYFAPRRQPKKGRKKIYGQKCRVDQLVNFDEAEELGLGHYQGRSGSGVRRWAVLVCLSQSLLKLAATGLIKLDLPKLNWPWYKREETVGQLRRRLIAHCRPRISRTLNETPTV